MKLSNLGYLIKEGIRNIWSNRMMSLASIGVLLSCLVLTGAAVMASLNVKTIVDKVGDSNETTVYMEDKATDAEITNAGKQMEGLSNVTSVSFFPKEEAIKDYKDVLGDKVFAEMEGDGNPLPSFEGEPTWVKVDTNDIDAWAKEIWENLNEDNKVSLFVRFIDIATGKYESRIINKNH